MLRAFGSDVVGPVSRRWRRNRRRFRPSRRFSV